MVTGNSVSKETFVAQIVESVQFCASEAGATFDIFASLGGSDLTLIERSDIDTLWEIFQLISGASKSPPELTQCPRGIWLNN